MSVDVVLKQKLFGNKTMPLETILGEKLTFGSYGEDGFAVKKITGSEIIVFNLAKMARGFSVVWNPNEKKQIIFSLPLPSTTEEITDFYSSVERAAKYWNAKVEVDGMKTNIEEFRSGLDFQLKASKAHLKNFCEDIIAKDSSLSFPAIRFPLTVEKEEAEIFMENPENFADWLHEKQNTVAAAPDARFYEDEGKICAYYMVVSGISSILPKEPKVPFGAQNPFTGGELECENWSVVCGIGGEPLAKLEYSDFMDRIPKEKVSRFDGDKILIKALTEDEIRELADK